SQPREESETAFGEQGPSIEPTGDEGESEEDESEEQQNFARADNQGTGERRPRRRGRRGGRRRRGDRDDGLAGSISDELTPPSALEAADAEADFDGGHSPAPSLPEVQPEPIAPVSEAQPAYQAAPEAVSAPLPEPDAHEGGKPARRSTVREKVSFGTSA